MTKRGEIIYRIKKCGFYVMVVLIVTIITFMIAKVQVFGDGGDAPSSGFTTYWEAEGYPKEQTQVIVNVIWDDKKGDNRPEHISLQLYKNDESYGEPGVLNEANGWSYCWAGLSADASWDIDEVEVPKDYVKEVVETTKNVYVVVNKYDPEGVSKAKAKNDEKAQKSMVDDGSTNIPIKTVVPNLNDVSSERMAPTKDRVTNNKPSEVAKDNANEAVIRQEELIDEGAIAPVNIRNVAIAVLICMSTYRAISTFRKVKRSKNRDDF